MEVILKKDVEKLGFAEDLVEVKNGYGRNFLIPQGLAILATSSAKKILAENLRQRAHKEQKVIDDATKIADKLKAIEALKLVAKSGADGRLFGSVTATDFVAELAKNEVVIDKKYVTILGGNIKRLGQYQAKLRFHRDVVVDYNFDVVAEA